ncbi:cobalamin biosynthesis protein CobD/CbiB [Cognaticolwellia mytili]|uniref:cobalamin biosynthesis protein CobD/CbiB n=1 Tax=Cognaticolwellia mytili TaxID=1888913 RepID=UPI001F1B7856|nr:CobD/CbiB family cobalamin biosynthesis protein [Cognaticolwellia mytili]
MPTLFEHIFQHHIFQQVVAILSEFSTALTLLIALLLDKNLGEAKRFHYLVGFGWLANKLAVTLNSLSSENISKISALKTKLLGTIAWCFLVIPLPVFYFLFIENLTWYWQIAADATVLYLALGLNSLHQHALQIYRPLKSGDLITARRFTGYIVSRETTALSEQEMSRATVESMLENGHDSVIASLVYYLIGGAPLVIVHRFANTLDAMWGYKNSRFINFGYASARLDDLLGFISGKCCTVLYAIQGLQQRKFTQAIHNAYSQGNQYKSHNGGWVMAAGATVMSRKLGGSAQYHGKVIHSPVLGSGSEVTNEDIPASLTLVSRASLLLLAIVFIFQLIIYLQ